MRRESFRMEVLNAHNDTIRELHPDVTGVSVAVKTGASIGRTLTGVVLRGDDLNFDPRTERLRPWMTIDGASSPLGVFLPTAATLHRLAAGDALEVQGHDQGFLLTRTFEHAFGVNKGDSVADALTDLAVLAGVTSTSIADTPITVGTWLAWPPGARIIDAMAAICRVAGLTTPWFDVTGTLRAVPLPYVGADKPRRAWHSGTASEITEGVTEMDDSWNRANEWLAISKSDDANLAGRYRLPDSHPLSVANGALPVVRTVDVPGVASTAQCRDRARDAAQRDERVHSVREFSVLTDPTLEQHDICTYEGTDYLLSQFDVPLQIGASQSITLRESLVVGEGS
jgi:hypothetical protein